MDVNLDPLLRFLGLFMPRISIGKTIKRDELTSIVKKTYPVYDVYYTAPFVTAFEVLTQTNTTTVEMMLRKIVKDPKCYDIAIEIYRQAGEILHNVEHVIAETPVCQELDKNTQKFTSFQLAVLAWIIRDLSEALDKHSADLEREIAEAFEIEYKLAKPYCEALLSRRPITGYYVYRIMKTLKIHQRVGRQLLFTIAGGRELIGKVSSMDNVKKTRYIRWLSIPHSILAGLSLLRTWPYSQLENMLLKPTNSHQEWIYGKRTRERMTLSLTHARPGKMFEMELTSIGVVLYSYIDFLFVNRYLKELDLNSLIERLAPIYCAHNKVLTSIKSEKILDLTNYAYELANKLAEYAKRLYIEYEGLKDDMNFVFGKLKDTSFNDVLSFILSNLCYLSVTSLIAGTRDRLVWMLLFLHEHPSIDLDECRELFESA